MADHDDVEVRGDPFASGGLLLQRLRGIDDPAWPIRRRVEDPHAQFREPEGDEEASQDQAAGDRDPHRRHHYRLCPPSEELACLPYGLGRELSLSLRMIPTPRSRCQAGGASIHLDLAPKGRV